MSNEHYIINIGNINIYNDAYLADLAGEAGFALSIKRLDDCNATIDVGTESDLRSANIELAEVDQMVGKMVRYGFDIKIVTL